MNYERLFMIIAGALGIAGFFLPFIETSDIQGKSAQVSGIEYVQTAIEYAQASPDDQHKFNDALTNSVNTYAQSSSADGYLKLASLIFILLGPIIFLLYNLSYFIKGLLNKSYKRGIFIALTYMLGSWAILRFYNPLELATPINFFSAAGLGFWLSFAGVVIAAFSLAFNKDV